MFWRTIAITVGLATAGWTQDGADLRSVVAAPENAPAIADTAGDPIEDALHAMSLEQKIAQLMFVTFESGQNPSSGERRILKGYTPGGVLVTSVMSPPAFEFFVRDLRLNPMEVQHKVPLLIGTNFYSLSTQHHTSSPYAPLPSLLALGASYDEEAMAGAAGVIADYMDVLGVSLHFGPSLSLSSRLPGRPVGYSQFGEDASLVTMAARAFGRKFLEKGVHWMPMGFPGGDANRNGSNPAVLVTPRSILGETDLLPFHEAIASGARFIHVSNVLVPTLEDEPVPASVSYAVLTKLLRDEMEFDGLIVAGPMDDPDLTRYYEGPSAPARSLMAGADMIWWGAPGPRPEQFIGRLAVAVQKHEVPESLIDERVRRVLRVKTDLGLLEKPLPRSRDIEKLIREQSKNALASTLEESGIVFVKVAPGLFPLSPEQSVPLGITGVVGVEELYEALKEEKFEALARFRIASARHGKQVYGFELDRLTKGAEGTRTLVCIFSAEVQGATQREILRRFKQMGTRVVTVMMGIPKDIDKYLDYSDALIIVLRPSEGPLASAMQALANVMLGRGPLRILQPTRDLVVRAGEAVTFDISGIAVTPAARLPISASELLPAGLGLGFSAPMDKRKVLWGLGDGQQATGPVIEHVYSLPGHYTLTVEVEQAGERIGHGTFGITVNPAS